MSKGEYISHTFTAESLEHKYINNEAIDEKLVRKGFELDLNISVTPNPDGSRTYKQFQPENKTLRQN